VRWTVRLRGAGSLEVEAVGMGDAEGWLRRAVALVWPELALAVNGIEVLEPDDEERIARRFRVRYGARAALEVEADDADDARRSALREARARIEGTTLARLEWTQVQTGEPR
jgi:hypothetical protein